MSKSFASTLPSTSERRKRVAWGEYAVICFLIVLITQPYSKFIFGNNWIEVGRGEIVDTDYRTVMISRISTIIVILGLVLVSAAARTDTRRISRALKIWLPFLCYITFTLLWRHDFQTIFRYVNFVAVIVAVVIYVSLPGRGDRFLHSYFVVTIGMLTFSLLLMVVGSKLVYFYNGYDFQYTALTEQKGLLAFYASTTTIYSFIKYTQKQNKYFYLFCLVVSLINLILSTTVTYYFATLVAIFAIGRFKLVGYAFLFLAVTLPFFFEVFSSFFQLIGKDVTLTGRVYLWRYTLEHSQGFWAIFGHGTAYVSETPGWKYMMQQYFPTGAFAIPHSHNLWVETIYKYGIIGFFILLYIFVRAASARRPKGYKNGVIFKSFFIVYIVSSAANVLFYQTAMQGILFMVLVTQLSLFSSERFRRDLESV
ncbi:O-antigen ligase family protein [Martelella lutilitoris]|uniref:O-antigen ligase family protein n=1 Tax=Martelella lutilitoris TaxID=2583532 RepID=A0A7T7HNJ3_9HYPH|nr:O-antigen ligase family protein [Martelella lutilitoris]QQM32437.1 O-antigen ligase family protein [Martelella lutilitoris]